jgi:hypothetical protein
MVLSKDFREFIKLLNENDVRYLLVGGYAVAAHGHPRCTIDMDWIRMNKRIFINVLFISFKKIIRIKEKSELSIL